MHRAKSQPRGLNQQPNLCYSVKYLGISHDQIGILTRKVPFQGSAPRQEHPTPEKYNKLVVHTYSRPRPLTAARKRREVDDETHWITKLNPAYLAVKDRFKIRPRFKVPVERTGVTGWKLSYPISKKPRKPSVKKTEPKPVKELEKYLGEPYLKVLHDKKAALPPNPN